MTNKTTRAARLQTTTLGALLDRQFPPRAVLLSPWLRSAESALLWAPTGVGKTMLVNTLALAVAGGGKVAGWEAETPRKVLLVDGEMHIEDLKERLEMLKDTVEGIDMEAARRNLVILSRQDQQADTRFPNLADEEGQDAIMARVRETGAELVILDNFSTLAEVADENEAAAMNPILSFLMQLKQANVACILVHHAGKAGNDYRGSSKLATTFEVIMGLKRLDGHNVTDGAAFELAWTKYRGKPTAATRDAEMHLGADGTGRTVWSTRATASSEMKAVVEAVRSCRHKTQVAIAADLGLSQTAVTRHKNKAIVSGEITKSEWNECLRAGRDETEEQNSDF
ncbi:AAA family ATPase [Acidocella sp.]|uniref:AAA family ATPase n=1 Tax=Acidocella sp. TaxID=50710 RepID=UPI0017946A26|nr:AAA family ATPase [Acidocella sp.]NNM56401.1 AAA family ATPase [Acidocella sp.]